MWNGGRHSQCNKGQHEGEDVIIGKKRVTSIGVYGFPIAMGGEQLL